MRRLLQHPGMLALLTMALALTLSLAQPVVPRWTAPPDRTGPLDRAGGAAGRLVLHGVRVPSMEPVELAAFPASAMPSMCRATRAAGLFRCHKVWRSGAAGARVADQRPDASIEAAVNALPAVRAAVGRTARMRLARDALLRPPGPPDRNATASVAALSRFRPQADAAPKRTGLNVTVYWVAPGLGTGPRSKCAAPPLPAAVVDNRTYALVAPDARAVTFPLGPRPLASDVVAGLDRVLAHRVANPGRAVLSLPVSLAGSAPLAGLLEAAVQEIFNNGTLVFVAAGDDAGDACDFSPARMTDIVTVGAAVVAGANVTFAPRANRGTCVSTYGPGGGSAAATGYVAGIGALVMETTNDTAFATAVVLDGGTWDVLQGAGFSQRPLLT